MTMYNEPMFAGFKRKDFLYLFFILFLYFILLAFLKPAVFSYRFNPALIERFFCSQEMVEEPPCPRLFLSDADVLIASGYLYAQGADPTLVHFQHPPLIKYLFGFSTLLFQNPYVVQIAFGILLLSGTYLLGLRTFRISEISLLAAVFLTIDPLFLNLIADASLDLGQAVFILLYLITIIFYTKNYLIHGSILGLLFASKFWGGSLFFVFLIAPYLFYKRRLPVRDYMASLGIAALVFLFVYSKTFIANRGLFNVIFFELKVVKYWFQHSVSSIVGASLWLFLTGYLKSWWGDRALVRSDIWSGFWAAGFFISLFFAGKELREKKIHVKFLIHAIPFLYLLYLGIQAPFTRYFIVILPFVHLSLAEFVWSRFSQSSRHNAT